MKNDERIIKELVKFVKEQGGINARLERSNSRLERSLNRIENLLDDHEEWMRSHEVRLTVHYDMIRKLEDKLR